MKSTKPSLSAQVLKKSQPEQFDLVILGGGTGSTVATWTFAGEGKRVAVVDRNYIGGSCPNIACLLSKNIIHSAKVASYFRRSKEFGIAHGGFTVEMSGVRDLLQGIDANFYGGTVNGGDLGGGTIFNINADLYTFGSCGGNPCGPYGGLVQGNDGNFYGTTLRGGSLGGGFIFKVSTSGDLTPLYEFGTDSNGDSCGSVAGLVYATDGNFYGVGGCGTLGME